MRENKIIEAIYPLSPQQQGVLFGTLCSPESGIHIEQLTCAFHGDLDLSAFQRAWQRVVDRHSILRTAFVWKDQDEPLQVVLERLEVSLDLQDWRPLSSCEQQEQLEAYLRADGCRGFELSRAPLMRLVLFQTGERAYQLVWTCHHILMDGWCQQILLKEFFSFYLAFSTGQDLQLERSRPYRDYIAWLKQRDLSEAEAFWSKTLQGFTRPTPLGVDADAGASFDQQERYGTDEAHLPAAATAALQAVARQHRLTLNTLVQGVWALLLRRYSGEEDVVFGVTVSGRPPDLAGMESMIGLFISTLPVRMKVSPEASLWPWLRDIQANNIELRQYEYTSGGQIHQWSEVPGSLALYESILVFENYPTETSIIQSPGLTIRVSNPRFMGAQTRYALAILIVPGSDLVFRLVYDSHRVGATSVTWILEHFLSLLNRIVADSEQHLGSLLDTIPGDQIPKFRPLQKRDQERLGAGFISPRDAIEFQLAHIWEDVLGIRPIGVRDNFFDLGGHSLLALRLIARIQKLFARDLPLSILFEGATVERLASVLREQAGRRPMSPLVGIQPAGSKRPFFCVHPGGGNVLCYVHLARHLGPEQPFYGLQAPGLYGEREPYTRIEEMAAGYIEALRVRQPQGPYLLGGWSAGGVVAFEMAQQLRREGHEVALLALVDSRAPSADGKNHRADCDADFDDAELLALLAKDMGFFFGKDLPVSHYDLRKLGLDEQLNYFLEQAKIVNLVPPDVGFQQIYRFFQVFKAIYRALRSYVPEVYPNPIILFRSSEVSPEDLWGLESDADVALGWSELSSKPLQITNVPGNHVTMLTLPHVHVLAEQLRCRLDEVHAANQGVHYA